MKAINSTLKNKDFDLKNIMFFKSKSLSTRVPALLIWTCIFLTIGVIYMDIPINNWHDAIYKITERTIVLVFFGTGINILYHFIQTGGKINITRFKRTILLNVFLTIILLTILAILKSI